MNEEQIESFKAIKDFMNEYIGKGGSFVSLKSRFTKNFVMALKEIGIYEPTITTFHSIRHTFAVRRYLQTRDIYQVSKELCHRSVQVTEDNYGHFDFEQLEEDFPTLIDGSNSSQGGSLETLNRETQAPIKYIPQ